MSTPEQPLTRKQMREVLRTGEIPIIRPAQDSGSDAGPALTEPTPSVPAVPPIPDSEVDLDAVPLTRREARQQERLRTASVPVISPEFAAAALAAGREAKLAEAEAEAEAEAATEAEAAIEADGHASDGAAQADDTAGKPERALDEDAVLEADEVSSTEIVLEAEDDSEPSRDEPVEDATDSVNAVVVDAAEASTEAVLVDAAEVSTTADVEDPADGSITADVEDDAEISNAPAVDDVEIVADANLAVETAPGTSEGSAKTATAAATDEEPVAAIHPGFGGHLLLDDPQIVAPMPASFDQLIARGSTATGSATATNALILSQTPTSAPLSGAVTATGEILITGMLDLPEGLGSTGHDPRHADGKEVDALLIDSGELPASSSPTPVAASSAISTIKSAGEIIKPPVPEKGSRLMFTLAITAGVLALALVGVLILGFITGAL